jgi:cytochrome b
MRQINLPMPIWDLPVRLFHWILVLLVGFMWASAHFDWMEWHMRAGYAIASLLLFRVVWGFVGSDTARFAFFLKSPIEALRHLSHLHKREPDHEIGHNAAGGWMVLGLLGLLAVQVASGLCANDDGATDGPFSNLVGKVWSDRASTIHACAFQLIKIAVLAHVLAVVAYAVLKGHDLVRPMITGKKRMPGAIQAPRMVSGKLALPIWLASAAIVLLAVKLAG